MKRFDKVITKQGAGGILAAGLKGHIMIVNGINLFIRIGGNSYHVKANEVTNIEDSYLLNKQKQISRIWQRSHRDGINYLKLMDMRKAIADQLYNNSLNRVFNRQHIEA